MQSHLVTKVASNAQSRALLLPIVVDWRSMSIGEDGGDHSGSQRGYPGNDLIAIKEFEGETGGQAAIDWSESSLSNLQVLSVRQYILPHSIQVVVIVDRSLSMNFGTIPNCSKSDVADMLVASIVQSAAAQQDHVSVITWSEQLVNISEGPVDEVLIGAFRLKNCAVSTPVQRNRFGFRSTTAGSKIASDNWMKTAFERLPDRRALVFVVSDFNGLSPSAASLLRQAGAVHDVRCVIVSDIRERELPSVDGEYPLVDMTTGHETTVWVNDSSRAAYLAEFNQHQAKVLSALRLAHCQSISMLTNFDTRQKTGALTRLFAGEAHIRPTQGEST